MPGLKASEIPQLLTQHYSQLVSERLGGLQRSGGASPGEWPLDRIADAYELVASMSNEPVARRSAAFVAATAQQIIARRDDKNFAESTRPANITRDGLDPALSAAILFLCAEQFADAAEASERIIVSPHDTLSSSLLVESIKDLAAGRLRSIIRRGISPRVAAKSEGDGLEATALQLLLSELAGGISALAGALMASDQLNFAFALRSARDSFLSVVELASSPKENADASLIRSIGSYPGPRHLASLLLCAHDALSSGGIANVPPPDGADPALWQRWVAHRAKKFPYIWPNHRAFIERGFHHCGISSVLVLPTGAGKTTVSGLKIAAVLATQKRVVFLAPTHALVEQLIDDLKAMFPRDIIGAQISSDFDLPETEESPSSTIEVMTPESCLASLCYSPSRFADVGLLVFDECHLLSPSGGKLRRAIDGMLCVLAFNKAAPEADYLFLSAMLQNGPRFADWVQELTSRPCISVDLLWKPSRQARGVVAFDKKDLENVVTAAKAVQSKLDSQKGKKAKDLRSPATAVLRARPNAIWGLQHNWLDPQGNKHQFSVSPLLSREVGLRGKLNGKQLKLLPNVNSVSATIAADAAKNGLKTIVLVNNKSHAVSTAREISAQLPSNVEATEDEKPRWEALAVELGSLDHSLLSGPTAAVPHNGSMLRLERDLAERMYQRKDGASVIVATPTLAQGLNLPAQLAILAGDKRTDADSRRSELEAHEILNAAARAGRAGHLANGVVLLVPDPVLEMTSRTSLPKAVATKLQAILPEDDRCVTINDPLESILDRIAAGEFKDDDVHYVINRMAALRASDDSQEAEESLFDIRKSFAAFSARQRGLEQQFESRVATLKGAIARATPEDSDNAVATLASQSGLPMDLLVRLRHRISMDLGSLPNSVFDWIKWALGWLSEDPEALDWLLGDVARSVNASLGIEKESPLEGECLNQLTPAIEAWIHGLPVAEIEKLLGGRPVGGSDTQRACPRAREFIGTVMPRGISYAMGLISLTASKLEPFEHQDDLSMEVLDCLANAARRGFDRPQKINFANRHREILSRVQAHLRFHEEEVVF